MFTNFYKLVAFANTQWDISIAQHIGTMDKHYSSMFLCDEWLHACREWTHAHHHNMSNENPLVQSPAMPMVSTTTNTPVQPQLSPPITNSTSVAQQLVPPPAATITTTPITTSTTSSPPMPTSTVPASMEHHHLTKAELIMMDKTIANFVQQATQNMTLPFGQALLGYSSQEQV